MSDEQSEAPQPGATVIQFRAKTTKPTLSGERVSDDPGVVVAGQLLRYLKIAVHQLLEQIDLCDLQQRQLRSFGVTVNVSYPDERVLTIEEHNVPLRREYSAIRGTLDLYDELVGWLERPPIMAEEQARVRELLERLRHTSNNLNTGNK